MRDPDKWAQLTVDYLRRYADLHPQLLPVVLDWGVAVRIQSLDSCRVQPSLHCSSCQRTGSAEASHCRLGAHCSNAIITHARRTVMGQHAARTVPGAQ